jgi:energy-coupling factor transporter ATP-binding protein EcfA2
MASQPLTDRDLAEAGLLTYEEMVEAGLVEEETAVTRVPFEKHFEYLHRTWKRGQHLSILGQTGSGKTHLLRWLLELWRDAEVLVIDLKGDDDAWEGDEFTRLKESPSWWDRFNAKVSGPRERKWWHLVPPVDRHKRRDIVSQALRSAFRRGNIVVVLDETRAIAGKYPNLALDEPAHVLWQQGRSKDVTVIAGAQSPVFLPSAFYDESRFLYVGFIADQRRLKRVGEIAADVDEMLQVAASTQEHEFVFAERKRNAKPAIVRAPKRLPRVRRPNDVYQLV